MRYRDVKQNRNLPRIASKSAVVTVLYSPSVTRSRKKMTLLEIEGTQPQRTYLTQRLSCENLQQRNNQQCSEMVVLLIHFRQINFFFYGTWGPCQRNTKNWSSPWKFWPVQSRLQYESLRKLVFGLYALPQLQAIWYILLLQVTTIYLQIFFARSAPVENYSKLR